MRDSEQTFSQIPKPLHIGLENMFTLYMARRQPNLGSASCLDADALNSKTRAKVQAKQMEEMTNRSLNRERLRLGAREMRLESVFELLLKAN